MRLSIITALYNCLPRTQAMLASLRATLPAELDWELLFVDDSSTDGTREWLAALSAGDPPGAAARRNGGLVAPDHREGGRIRILLQPENLGFAAANNRAATVATGDTIALLNNDLEFAPGWLEPMLSTLDARPDAALIGNVQRTPAGAIHHTGIFINARGKPEHDRRLPTPAPADGIREVVATTAACALIRRTAFERLHGFDEAFRNGHEDIDLCLRARAAGRHNCVALASSVVHHVSASPGRGRLKIENAARSMNRWRDSLPDLAGEAWCDPHLRAAWNLRLPFTSRLRTAFIRPPDINPAGEFPAWLRRSVAGRIARQLARWRRDLGGTLPE